MKRPGPVRWMWYALAGTLPSTYAEWVLHDTTARTWLLRHLARVLAVLAVPLAIMVVLIPAGAGTRVLVAVTVAGCVLLLLTILSSEATERRAHNAGYRWGTAAAIRNKRAEDAQRRTAARYRERVAARQRHV